jgi:hypothetical protein
MCCADLQDGWDSEDTLTNSADLKELIKMKDE